MTKSARFLAAINRHASTLTLEAAIDLARAAGFRLRVVIEEGGNGKG